MLKIGNKTFSSQLIQAPLAGFSCAPMRVLAARYGQVAYCCTEMISAKDLLKRQTTELDRYTYKDPEEGPLCLQLSGNDATELAEAAGRALVLGADLIDLNCGCPKPKLRKKGVGSRLLADADHLATLVSTLKSHNQLPLTVKIRVDGHSRDGYNQAVATACASAGADAVIVHGRHWTEDYDVACHYDQIAQIASCVDIPVIGNGDIADLTSLKRMLDTGVAGVMIARASTGRPWLFAQLSAELAGNAYLLPNRAQVGETCLEHIQRLAALIGEYPACLQARKIVRYYARDWISSEEFSQQLYQINSLETLTTLVNHYFLRY